MPCKVFARSRSGRYDRTVDRLARLSRRVATSVVAVIALGCGERSHAHAPLGSPLKPAPPPPPGSIAVWGAMHVEAVDVVRSEIGWDRDLVHAARVVAYDVVIAQDRATCAEGSIPQRPSDAEGCAGLPTIPSTCKVETTRARVEATVTYALELSQRCAGDATPYVVADGADARAALTTLASACFRTKNKFRPESTWSSLYALTELSIVEHASTVSTTFPRLLSRALSGSEPTFCRDDGAYLDGSPGRPGTVGNGNVDPSTLAQLLQTRAPLSGETSPIALTASGFRSEQALWEECKGASLSTMVVAEERCQLLRQLDRFVRDVEDLARPETPKGAPTSSTSASPSTSTGKP